MFFAAFSFLVVKSTWISIVCLLLARHWRAFVRWFMRTLLDRYRAGERGNVWDEIRERGAERTHSLHRSTSAPNTSGLALTDSVKTIASGHLTLAEGTS